MSFGGWGIGGLCFSENPQDSNGDDLASLPRLQVTSTDFHDVLVKKKDSEALLEEKEKLLPIDSFGIVMMQHGEEFGEESAYGTMGAFCGICI